MDSSIDFHKFSKGETCTTTGCRSRYYYIQDGKRVCKSHGHVQEGFTQIAADEDDFNTEGRKTRKRRKEVAETALVYEGIEALKLYAQCWQVVLRKQAAWLINTQGMPPELETVIRDLWAVRIRNIKGLGEDEKEAKDRSGFSSTTEGGSNVEDGGGGMEMKRRVQKLARERGLPKLIESLALCYMAMLLLRLPVTLGEIQNWVEQYQIPYFRVIREIPADMRSHLPPKYYSALETRSPLRRGRLQQCVGELMLSFTTNFNIVFPPLNASLVMFKFVKDLCLPLEVYRCSSQLAAALRIGFQYPKTLSRHKMIEYPELQVAALIVISLKLLQPFDDILRSPESHKDPSVLKINWDDWATMMALERRGSLIPGQEVEVTEADVFNMDADMLDNYLDWYQRTWLSEKEPKMPQQILDLFPVEHATRQKEIDFGRDSTSPALLMHIQGRLEVQKPISLDDGQYVATINRPGNCYTRWQGENDLSSNAQALLIRAAEMAGTTAGILIKAVYSIEQKLASVAAGEQRSALQA